MAQSDLPSDPLAAHEVVMKRAEQLFERRREERRNPLPEQAQAEVGFARGLGLERIQAEVLELSTSGMRLAAFADHQVQQGDRCAITVQGNAKIDGRWAKVIWVNQHPLIQVFGVQFDPLV